MWLKNCSRCCIWIIRAQNLHFVYFWDGKLTGLWCSPVDVLPSTSRRQSHDWKLWMGWLWGLLLFGEDIAVYLADFIGTVQHQSSNRGMSVISLTFWKWTTTSSIWISAQLKCSSPSVAAMTSTKSTQTTLHLNYSLFVANNSATLIVAGTEIFFFFFGQNL